MTEIKYKTKPYNNNIKKNNWNIHPNNNKKKNNPIQLQLNQILRTLNEKEIENFLSLIKNHPNLLKIEPDNLQIRDPKKFDFEEDSYLIKYLTLEQYKNVIKENSSENESKI